MKKLIYLLFVTTILLSSCAKETSYLEAGVDTEGEGGSGGGTSTAALEGTKWKMTALLFGQEIAGQKVELDLLKDADACSKDNIMSFEKQGVFIFDEGATKCDSSDPQQEKGTWSLSADKKKLTLTSLALNDDTGPITYDVVATSTKLTLTVKETMTVTAEGQTITTTIYTTIVFAAHK